MFYIRYYKMFPTPSSVFNGYPVNIMPGKSSGKIINRTLKSICLKLYQLDFPFSTAIKLDTQYRPECGAPELFVERHHDDD